VLCPSTCLMRFLDFQIAGVGRRCAAPKGGPERLTATVDKATRHGPAGTITRIDIQTYKVLVASERLSCSHLNSVVPSSVGAEGACIPSIAPCLDDADQR
jgi:hypothetical protein